jgi:hypothetical protein
MTLDVLMACRARLESGRGIAKCPRLVAEAKSSDRPALAEPERQVAVPLLVPFYIPAIISANVSSFPPGSMFCTETPKTAASCDDSVSRLTCRADDAGPETFIRQQKAIMSRLGI